MKDRISYTARVVQLVLRTWSRGRLPCAERWKRYFRRESRTSNSPRQDRARATDRSPWVPRFVDDEWPPWPRARNDAPSERRRL